MLVENIIKVILYISLIVLVYKWIKSKIKFTKTLEDLDKTLKDFLNSKHGQKFTICGFKKDATGIRVELLPYDDMVMTAKASYTIDYTHVMDGVMLWHRDKLINVPISAKTKKQRKRVVELITNHVELATVPWYM